MKLKDFVSMERTLEYFVIDEVIRDLRSTKKYNEKYGKVYLTDDEMTYIAAEGSKYKKFIKDGWFKTISHRDLISLGSEYRNQYGQLYTIIKCFFGNTYRAKLNKITFTNNEIKWYQNEALKIKNELVEVE